MIGGATEFLRKKVGNNKGTIIAGSGVSLATLALCYQLFATKSSNDSQWRRIESMQRDINELQTGLAQNDALLLYIIRGEIRQRPTNRTERP